MSSRLTWRAMEACRRAANASCFPKKIHGAGTLSVPTPLSRGFMTESYHCWHGRVPRYVVRHSGVLSSGNHRRVLNHSQCQAVHSSAAWPNTQPMTNVRDPLPHHAYSAYRQGRVRTAEELCKQLEVKQSLLYEDYSTREVNVDAVFTNSELSLKYVDVYGFDFDYTLVHYTTDLHRLIYQTSRDRLVDKLRYPTKIKSIAYDPNFAIRGLHCDVRNGFVMKIDTYNHIQLSSVYKGHQPVSHEEVFKQYGGNHVPMSVMDNVSSSSNWKLIQFLDLFSIPEVTLLADVTEYLTSHNIPFDDEYLVEDVRTTVQEVHHSGEIHSTIISNPERYMDTTRVPEFLNRLKSAGKKLFLITNSSYWFVNQGMTHLMKTSEWKDLFDVVIVEARKPSFFSDAQPFRVLNSVTMTPTWMRVNGFEPGRVYFQGNMDDFTSLTGWKGSNVLYFGDHVFGDLADPTLQHGWKTGAIIPELKTEIKKAGSEQFRRHLSKLLATESLLNEHQGYDYTEPELLAVLESWRKERTEAKKFLKTVHNPRFGSVFRTEKSPTYFSRRLATFSNLYTSSLDHLMKYSLDFTFIPRRSALPHEPDLNFDI